MTRRRSPHHRPSSPKPSRPPHESTSGAPAARLIQSSSTVDGVLDLKGRVGFILSEKPGETDVLVQGPSLALALNGDRVRVAVRHVDKTGRRMGEILSVLVHVRKTMTGVFRRDSGQPRIDIDGERFLRITDEAGLSPREGDLVVVRITAWPTLNTPASGILIESLGDPSRPETDLARVLNAHEIPVPFVREADTEAAGFGNAVPDSAWAGRRTFFKERVFTIDGADAKDFDDAVHIETLPNGAGWRLGVHIADVSHYVRDGAVLDRTARERGTSVYFPGHVVPMLPFSISDNLCSLRPDEVRLTLTCVMDINPAGEVFDHHLYESAIKSSKRFTYDDVDVVLRGETLSGLPTEIASDVKLMGSLASLLRKRRMGRGSLDFDFPEPHVTTDPHGRVIDIQKKERLESHKLVEDFMLLANETVATHMSKFPFLYRIHEKPDPTKLELLKKTLDSVGLSVGKSADLSSPKKLQAVLASATGRPIQTLVHLLVLRSLKQAIYSPTNAGHFGLASPCYSHFTSPIRRYPDLIVHRLVREHLQGKLTPARQTFWSQEIPKIGEETSRLERRAVQAERDYMAMQKVRLMESKVGEEYDGVISSVTSFGFFVELSTHFVEGLVRLTDLDDYFIFDEVRLVLRGKRSGKVFSIGQPVRVRLAGVNLTKGQLDFKLLSATATSNGAPSGRPPAKHRDNRRRR